jgi:methionine-rich copper-binding protein CopC
MTPNQNSKKIKKPLTIVMLIFILSLMLPFQEGQAHMSLERTSPDVNEILGESPKQIELWFQDNVTVFSKSVQVLDPEGRQINIGEIHLNKKDPRHIIVPLNEELGQGEYRVNIHVLAPDDDPVRETYRFIVERSEPEPTLTPEEKWRLFELERTYPEDGMIVDSTPNRIELWFTQPAELTAFGVFDDKNQPISFGDPYVDPNNPLINVIELPEALSRGTYSVNWYATMDGQREKNGVFYFAVYEVTPLAPSAQKSPLIDWVSSLLMFTFGGISLRIWGKGIYQSFVYKDRVTLMRLITLIGSLLVWLGIVLIQNRISAQTELYEFTQKAGYFILPFALFALWRVVLHQTKSRIQGFSKHIRYRIILIFGIIGYSLFYLFASGMLYVPEAENANNANGYSYFFYSQGFLTAWPNIEFWWPSLLAGSFRLDGLMIYLTFVGFMGINMGSLIRLWMFRREKASQTRSVKTTSQTLGIGLVTAVLTSACCSLPLFYPILLLVLSLPVADALTYQLMDESGMLFNLLQIMMLSLMYFITITLSKQVQHKEGL